MTVKRKTLFFTILILCVTIGIGITTYMVLVQKLGRNTWKQETEKFVETKKLLLETSVTRDIALAMKWADSAITKEYFLDPNDKGLQSVAFEEFSSFRNSFSGKSNFWANDVDKKFYSNDEFSYVINPQDPSDYWYNMTLYETKQYNFNINYNPNLNQTCLWINAPVFNKSKSIGIVGTGIILDAFIDNVYKDIDPHFNTYFFNKNNEITGATDKELIANKINILEKFPEFADDISSKLNNLNSDINLVYENGNNICILTYVSVLDWYMFTYVPITYSMVRTGSVRTVFLIALIILLCTIAVFVIFIFKITDPLSKLEKVMSSVAEGDFTSNFHYSINDEIGSLSTGLSSINGTVSDIIDNVHSQAFSVHNLNSEIQNYLSSCSSLTDDIVEELKEASNILSGQTVAIQKTAAVTIKNKDDLNQFEEKISTQSNVIKDSADKIREMLDCVSTLDSIRTSASDQMNNLSTSSTEGSGHLKNVISQIEGISSGSEKLLETNRLISSISEQTNLLAMNASIEAAHAGEAGKGFAVVAGEIRNLASKTRVQSEEVEKVIKDIISSVENVVNYSETTNLVFSKIVSLVKDVYENFSKMSNIIEKENNLSTEISYHLTSLSDSSSSVSLGFTGMKNDTISVATSMEQANKQSDVLIQAFEEISAHAGDIDKKVSEVAKLANKNEEELTRLDKGLNKYKIL